MAVTEDSRELDVLKAVAARLAGAFPDTSIEEVDSSVQQAYRRFDGSRVRTFVPLLVEHAVRDELAARRREARVA